ncbi:Unknown protein [Striga hermonthica]|uniref:Uncharacterized protein n=1 Tax=Striga hermonthica TaxID=68872 RepID=A0A9N7N7B0_STRHE|nr:Unknown protein [Striga hermonthica]
MIHRKRYAESSRPSELTRKPTDRDTIMVMLLGLERLMMGLKSKLKSMKITSRKACSDYDKIEKSESMRIELRSRKARKLIHDTLKIADSPKTRSYTF